MLTEIQVLSSHSLDSEVSAVASQQEGSGVCGGLLWSTDFSDLYNMYNLEVKFWTVSGTDKIQGEETLQSDSKEIWHFSQNWSINM